MEPRVPRQARKGAAVNEPFHVPRGRLGAAARRWKAIYGHKGGGARKFFVRRLCLFYRESRRHAYSLAKARLTAHTVFLRKPRFLGKTML